MKKYLLFTLMLFASPVVFAQTTVDTVDIRICYDVRMRLYKNKKKRVDEHWLDIGKNGISKYYSYWKRVDQELMDSVYAAGGDYDEYNKIKREKDNPRSSFEFTIFKNYQQNDQLTGICTPYSGSKYLFTEEMGQDWEPRQRLCASRFRASVPKGNSKISRTNLDCLLCYRYTCSGRSLETVRAARIDNVCLR